MSPPPPIERRSAVYNWPVLTALLSTDAAIAAWAERRGSLAVFAYEFVRFGAKQAWACLFGGIMLALMIGTALFYPHEAALPRYDFLTLAAITVQVALIATRMETLDEAKVILLYHVVGTVMELFKTAQGSWIYPDPAYLRIGGVPLFTGFMYACVGSYIARAWRLFDFRFTAHPPLWATLALATAIYVNFFAHHFITDMRLALFAITAVLFGRCWIYFKIHRHYRRMPLLLGFALVALFIWFAENLGTLTRTWIYPSQADGWSMVAPAKLGSWFLLMIISYVLVSLVNPPQPFRRERPVLAPQPAPADG
ncbi:DUF817 domain-containing protein [Rhodoligotrophos defluvii]|uniref:DUF817 domain-containing protein n=1 Tax=Rhodoligotrophos defluvii TaxID=2561934 RepID=UPI0010C9C51D|nr:DUF817 domain-containing protein [Rhodoligotrophos defluvii]